MAPPKALITDSLRAAADILLPALLFLKVNSILACTLCNLFGGWDLVTASSVETSSRCSSLALRASSSLRSYFLRRVISAIRMGRKWSPKVIVNGRR
jgi:hypothetical protein